MIDWVRLGAWAGFALLFALFAWTDIRYKKIRNGAILTGLAGALAAYGALAFWTWRAEGRYFVWGFYEAAFTHTAAAWAAGLLLWTLRLWPAGDAKLFMLLGVFYPLLAPQLPLSPWRATLAVLINAFIPAALAIMAGAFLWLWRTRVARRLEAARSAGTPLWTVFGAPRAAGLAAEARAGAARMLGAWAAAPGRTLLRLADWAGFFMAAALLLDAAVKRFGSAQWTGLVLCAFSFFVWSALGGLLGPLRPFAAWAAVAAAFWRIPELDARALAGHALQLGLFGAAVGSGMQVLFSWMKGGSGLWWLWAAAPLLLGLAGPWLGASLPWLLAAAALGAGAAAVAVQVKEDVLDWKAESIEPFLVLTPHSLEVIGRDGEFFEEHFETLFPDGLTHEQAVALKAWCARNSVPGLTMQRTLSFAVWIFAGYAITAWLGADLIAVLARRLA